jgi:uncharacterized surface protein with fasciclin (FAS1) repeats
VHTKRILFLSLTASAAILAGLCLSAPGFAGGKGGGGGGGAGGGGGSSGKSGGSGSGSKAPAAKPKEKNLLDVIGEDTSLSKFAAALKLADLEGTLKGTGPFTVLAPNDAAFGKLDAAKWADLQKPAMKAQLKSLIEGLIVSGKKTAADIAKATSLDGQGGAKHAVKLGDDKQPTIDGAKIARADVTGSNGLIQILDTVPMPPEKAAPPPAGK